MPRHPDKPPRLSACSPYVTVLWEGALQPAMREEAKVSTALTISGPRQQSELEQSGVCLSNDGCLLLRGPAASWPGNIFSWDNLQPFSFSFLVKPGNQIHRENPSLMSLRGIARNPTVAASDAGTMRSWDCDEHWAPCPQTWVGPGVSVGSSFVGTGVLARTGLVVLAGSSLSPPFLDVWMYTR